ncbi:MAG: hypothetical protein V1798_08795 [Pseudomonadota bacterium]
MRSKKGIIALAFLAGFLVSSSPGWAQEKTAPSSGKKQRIIRAGKTVYDFDEVDLTGRLKRPEQQSVVEAPDARFRRLLDLDESFVPQIIRSVDEF